MSGFKWININDQKPLPNQHILAKFKYGTIECRYDDKRENVGCLYMWESKEFYIQAWMPFEAFENVETELAKEKKRSFDAECLLGLAYEFLTEDMVCKEILKHFKKYEGDKK